MTPSISRSEMKARHTTKFQEYLWRRTRRSAISNGEEFALQPEDFPHTLPPSCPVLGSPIEYPSEVYVKRLNDNYPYELGNIQLMCKKAFFLLIRNLSPEEWVSLIMYQAAQKDLPNVSQGG